MVALVLEHCHRDETTREGVADEEPDDNVQADLWTGGKEDKYGEIEERL